MHCVVPFLMCILPAASADWAWFATPPTGAGAYGMAVEAAWKGDFGPAAVNPPVDRGRDALRKRWRYPWYDADADALRRVDIPEPSAPPAKSIARSESWLPAVLQYLGWLGIAAILGLMAWLVVAAWRTRDDLGGQSAPDQPRVGPDRIEAIPIPGIAAAKSYLDEARRLYEQGDFGRAVACLFAHQLLELDRAQIVRLARGKTNRQYLREIGRRLKLRQLVEQTMVAFEDVFFGNRQMDRARFEACWGRLPEFDSLVAGGSA